MSPAPGVASSGSLFKNILQSSGIYSIASLGQPIVATLLLPIITGYLRPPDYGILGTIEQVAGVLALLLGGNFGSAIGYFYFQQDSAATRRPVIGTAVLGAAIAGVLTGVVCWVMGGPLSSLVFRKETNEFYLRMMALGMPASFMIDALFAWLRVEERVRTYLWASLLRVIVGAAAALLLVAVFHLKVLGMVLSGLAAVTIPTLVLLPIWWRVGEPKFDGGLFVRMAKFTAPVGVGGLALFFINFGDRLILPRYVSMADVGLYTLAYKIGMMASMAYASFHTYWSAQAFGLMKRDDADALFARLLTYAVGVISLSCLGLIVFSKPAIRLLAHHDYSGAAALVPVIAIAYGIRSLGDFFRMRYYLAGHPAYDAIGNTIGAGLCLAGYLYWIPRFGVWGAAFATVVAFSSVLGIALIWTYRIEPYAVEGKRLLKMGVALAAGLGAFMAAPKSSLAGQIAAAALVVAGFPVLLWVFRFPTPAEREAVGMLVRRIMARMAPAGRQIGSGASSGQRLAPNMDVTRTSGVRTAGLASAVPDREVNAVATGASMGIDSGGGRGIQRVMRVRQVQAGEEDRIIAFLRAIFQPDPGDPFLEPAQVRWRFFEPGPDWPGSRSYVLELGGEIVAHGCIWPITLAAASGDIRAAHVIDWAASRKVPGVGLILLDQLSDLAGIRIAMGGSQDALRMGRAGRAIFRQYGELTRYVRVVRPRLQFSADPRKNWKSVARWLRNAAILLRPEAGRDRLTAERVDRFEKSPMEGFHPASFTPVRRSADFLNFLLRCPAARFAAYRILDDGATRGYFVLSEVGAETRIADVCVDSRDAGGWAAAYALAAHVACQRPDVAIVTTAALMPLATEAVVRAGFRAIDQQVVTTNQAGLALKDLPPLHLTLLDNDGAFLA